VARGKAARTRPATSERLTTAEAHSRAIQAQIAAGQHLNDLEADGRLAELRNRGHSWHNPPNVSPWTWESS
jgi:hypothetical protein